MHVRCTLVLPPDDEAADLTGCTVELLVEDTSRADAAAPVVAASRAVADTLARDGRRLGPVDVVAPDPPVGEGWNLRGVLHGPGPDDAPGPLLYVTTQAVTARVSGVFDVPLTRVG